MAIWSKVGLGMNLLTLPATMKRFRPSISAHCMQRFFMDGSMWRMKASGAS